MTWAGSACCVRRPQVGQKSPHHLQNFAAARRMIGRPVAAGHIEFYKRSMIPGGIADKRGNRYEMLWTLLQALDVLRGLSASIRIEPFDEDAKGFEFKLVRSHRTEWHQCKSRQSAGSWTIQALKREGILSDFARKLADAGAWCVFVSSDPAKPFKNLCEKAGVVDNASTFQSSLSNDDQFSLRSLCHEWGVDLSTAYERLKRCRVEIVSEEFLLRQLESLCPLLFKDVAGAVIDRMATYLEGHLTHTLTTELLQKAATNELGLKSQVHLDAGIDRTISDATTRYLGSLRTTIAGERIATQVEAEATRLLLEQATPKYLLVAGQAGGGKSSAVAGLIEAAKKREWPVLAFRMDRLLDVTTMNDLGQAILGRAQNPVAVFGNRNLSRPALLVIDQADAVSEASGRATKVRDFMFEMIEVAERYPGLRIAIACRSYDLSNDFQLSRLSESPQAASIQVGPLEWDEAVVPILRKLGLDARRYSDNEKRILSLPLNLNLFAEIALSGESVAGELSTARLIGKLLQVREREFASSGIHWTPAAALGALAEYMSREQVLSAPEAVLGGFPAGLDKLGSGGLITRSGAAVQFVHESFFDYVFAAQFLASTETVLNLLLGDEQRLFRRTQVRQIFAQLRDAGGRRYLSNLSEVMNSAKVRYLVKDAVAAWLMRVERPTPAELKIVVDWFEPSHSLFSLAKTILWGPGWLEVISGAGLTSRWLEEPGENETFAFWLLRGQATLNPGLVRGILTAWWKRHADRIVELLNWFRNLHPDGSIGELEELYGELVRAAPAELFAGGSLPAQAGLGGWAHGDPQRGARVLGHWIKRWMAVIPDGQALRDRYDQSDRHWIEEIASKAPDSFLEEMLPALAECVRRDLGAIKAGDLVYSLFEHAPREGSEELEGYLDFIRQSLQAVAKSNPAKAEMFLGLVPVTLGVTTLHLHLEAIAANGAALAHCLPPLLECPRLLESGFQGASWLSFAKAAREAWSDLDDGDRLRIEALTCGHRPEVEYILRCLERENAEGKRPLNSNARRHIAYELTRTGFEERAILKTIGWANLSPTARKRLDELERKFPNEPLPEPQRITGGWVSSPIPAEAAAKMSDRQWLSAMKRYQDNSRHRYLGSRLVGSCRELSNVLKEETKKDPDRFAALFEQIPLDFNSDYAEGIVWGIGESPASAEVASRVFRTALSWPAKSFGRALSWAIERKPEAGAIPEVLGFLQKSAADGDASDSITRTKNDDTDRNSTVRGLLQNDGDLTINGINSERGAAYEALAAVLWQSEGVLADVLSFIEPQIEREDLGSVQACMTRVINSVARYQPEKAIDLLLKLTDRNLSPVSSHAGQHLLHWAVYNYSARVEGLIGKLERSEAEGLRALGLFLRSGLALSDDGAEANLRGLWPDDVLARRVSAFRASGNLSSDAFRHRAARWVVPFFDDEERQVRDEASHCRWKELLDPDSGMRGIVEAYVASRSFE